MKLVNCNLCGSTEQNHVYSKPDTLYCKGEWFDVVECKECGLGFVNPMPSPCEMGRYYPSLFYDYFADKASEHLLRYRTESEYLKSITRKDRLLLDVGCANGDFPRFMQSKGWQVEGVEIAESSRPISEFKVFRTELSKIPISEPRYDAITAWAVIEHVHDPMAYFMKVGEILKPGGLFVFLVTNFKSITSRYLFHEDIPRHLYFFSEETIGKYMKKAGLELVMADYSDKIYQMKPLNWLRHYLYKVFLQRPLKWEDIPETRVEYLARHKLSNNIFGNVRYAATHPLTVMDRAAMPVYEKLQLLLNAYGIVVYVTRKPDR
jgi:2-polyprenyl-3-methyl-5-hydroxy-6-metoxy-1,4-benzoquinol methylase